MYRICSLTNDIYKTNLISFDFKINQLACLSKNIIHKLLTKLSTVNCKSVLLFVFVLLAVISLHAQNDSTVIRDSIAIQKELQALDVNETDTLQIIDNDSLLINQDTSSDTISSDSLTNKPSTLEYMVDYKAKDSIRFDLRNKKVYLFNQADITYGSINLTGDYMEIDFKTNEIVSSGIIDSIGNTTGTPVFKESDDEFVSKEIKYNFDTKKGLIRGVSTEESGGFLHGEIIKKMPDNTAYIRGGEFTTCDLEHPHYAFRFRKSKVIPGDKIITGPAYFEIADVPTPILVPFGLFPNQSGKQSGIIVPTYGEVEKQGFYFKDGGYYWAVSDYMDLTFLGSIYTRGSWSLGTLLNYKKRYKHRGDAELKYSINIVGNEGSPDYRNSKDFLIRWSHSQDPKARPKSNFSANVNIRSSSFNEYELGNTFNDRLSNTFQSSINYSTRFGESWNLNVGLGHSQNTQTRIVNLKIPDISFGGARFFPLRKKNRSGSIKWWENISMKYTVVARNEISIADSLLFTSGWEKNFKNGMKHTIPISSTVKVLKHLNWTNSFTFNSRWYSNYINQYYVDTTFGILDTIPAYIERDTINGFITANDFNFSSGFQTRVYGMYTFGKKFPIQAIRHVISPNISFSWRPDFSEDQWGYYDTYSISDTLEPVQYSIFDGAIYGSPPSGKQGSLNFSLSNNLEMKVRDRNDTLTGTRKVVLIDNLTISASYNMAKDSLKWSTLNVSGRTKLFKNLDIRYTGIFDPYILDSTGTYNLDQYEWNVNKRLFRKEDMSWTTSFNLTLNDKTFSKKPEDPSPKTKEKGEPIPEAVSIPWSLNLNYSLSYKMRFSYPGYVRTKENDIVQTLGFSGNVQVTPNWKVSFRSGYDFERNELSYTSVDIYRDLHCWEMRFGWIPFGTWKSWNFGINIKSTMFKDLKVERKKTRFD